MMRLTPKYNNSIGGLWARAQNPKTNGQYVILQTSFIMIGISL